MNKLIKNVFLLGLIVIPNLICNAQNISLKKVEPPFWWVGMENTDLQLLVYGKNISLTKPVINYPGVTIQSVSTLASPNYLFIDLAIGKKAKSGTLNIQFENANGNVLKYNYKLKNKRIKNNKKQLIDPSDVIYLITPDRFANGNTKNDSTDDTLEKVNRKNIDGRHGGDLQGVINHLDYIQNLGITTLWLNPFLENNQPKYSYHGYGISDFYKTDSRFGTNKDFNDLVVKSHNKGMKVIMDQVFNHCGAGHWWMDDLPSKDWLNQWTKFTRSNFTNIAASDPHVSQSDYDLLTRGWFDNNLPDLNLDNTFLATYLIQNSIWWVEFANLDGIRMDTYPYPNKNVMAQWTQRLKLEYPNLFVVAETWVSKSSSLSYWNRNTPNADGYNPHLMSVSDYPVYYAMLEAFGNQGDVYKLYETLADDFIYGNPYNNKIFNGNHDVARIFTLLNEDISKLKLSMTFILTTRGIPQLYYGDEILFKGDKPDGILRKDFPGGWDTDTKNAFSKNGRTKLENDAYNYVNTILNWRKNAKEVHEGKLKHYQPLDNVYVYFRYTETESTMIIINNNNFKVDEFSLERFKESLSGYSIGKDIITNTHFSSLKKVNLKENSALVIKLQR